MIRYYALFTTFLKRVLKLWYFWWFKMLNSTYNSQAFVNAWRNDFVKKIFSWWRFSILASKEQCKFETRNFIFEVFAMKLVYSHARFWIQNKRIMRNACFVFSVAYSSHAISKFVMCGNQALKHKPSIN